MGGEPRITEACCATPSAMCYWLIVFFAVLVPLSAAAVYWHPLSHPAGLFAAGVACVSNFAKNRTYHCGISGPILIVAGAILLVAEMHLIQVEPGIVWIAAGTGVLGSLLLEWRYAKRLGRLANKTAGDHVDTPAATR